MDLDHARRRYKLQQVNQTVIARSGSARCRAVVYRVKAGYFTVKLQTQVGVPGYAPGIAALSAQLGQLALGSRHLLVSIDHPADVSMGTAQ